MLKTSFQYYTIFHVLYYGIYKLPQSYVAPYVPPMAPELPMPLEKEEIKLNYVAIGKFGHLTSKDQPSGDTAAAFALCMESLHDVEQQQQLQEEAEGREGRRDGLWDVLDSLVHQTTVTIKMEPGIGVSVCNSNCPKELTYLGQHPTFTRPFVPSIIPSPS